MLYYNHVTGKIIQTRPDHAEERTIWYIHLDRKQQQEAAKVASRRLDDWEDQNQLAAVSGGFPKESIDPTVSVRLDVQ